MKKNNKRTTQQRIKNPRSKIASEAVFILLTALGIYILVALYTSDLINEDPITSGKSLQGEVKNMAGVLGAKLSDFLINWVLGYVAYIIPISLLWLGYNFYRDARKEKKDPLIYIFRLIAYFVMVFFTAALAHQYAPEIQIIEGVKDTFLLGGSIGKTIHEMVFFELFGAASTVIYVDISSRNSSL